MAVLRIFLVSMVVLQAVCGSPLVSSNVTPQRYAVTFTLASDKLSFTGKEEIDVTVAKQTNTFVLHYNELAISSIAVLDSDYSNIQVVKSVSNADEKIQTITVASALQVDASYKIAVIFSGQITDSLTIDSLMQSDASAHTFPYIEDSSSSATYEIKLVTATRGLRADGNGETGSGDGSSAVDPNDSSSSSVAPASSSSVDPNPASSSSVAPASSSSVDPNPSSSSSVAPSSSSSVAPSSSSSVAPSSSSSVAPSSSSSVDPNPSSSSSVAPSSSSSVAPSSSSSVAPGSSSSVDPNSSSSVAPPATSTDKSDDDSAASYNAISTVLLALVAVRMVILG